MSLLVGANPEEVPVKQWWASRTLWVNLLAVVAIILQTATGKELFSIEAQTAVLAILNIILRARTNQGLE